MDVIWIGFFVATLMTLGCIIGIKWARLSGEKEGKESHPYAEFDHTPEVLANLYTVGQLEEMVESLFKAKPKGTYWSTGEHALELRLMKQLRQAIALSGMQTASTNTEGTDT